jgi:hypothetical protein
MAGYSLFGGSPDEDAQKELLAHFLRTEKDRSLYLGQMQPAADVSGYHYSPYNNALMMTNAPNQQGAGRGLWDRVSSIKAEDIPGEIGGFAHGLWDSAVNGVTGPAEALRGNLPAWQDDGTGHARTSDALSRAAFDAAAIAPLGGIAAPRAGAVQAMANDSRASLPALAASDSKGIRAYHGTGGQLDGGVFDLSKSNDIGPHFGPDNQANHFARRRASQEGEGGLVYPVDINMKSPVTIPDQFTWKPERVAKAIEEKYPEHAGIFDEVAASGNRGRSLFDLFSGQRDINKMQRDKLLEAMDRRGIDGIRYNNWTEGNGEPAYIATKRGTVKSATTGETLFSNDSRAAIPGLAASDSKGINPEIQAILQRLGLLPPALGAASGLLDEKQ